MIAILLIIAVSILGGYFIVRLIEDEQPFLAILLFFLVLFVDVALLKVPGAIKFIEGFGP